MDKTPSAQKRRIDIFAALVLGLFLPAGAAFGFAYIDLGLLHGNDNGSGAGLELDAREETQLEIGQDSIEVDTDADASLNDAAGSGATSSASVDAQGRAELESGIETNTRVISVTRSQVSDSDVAVRNITPSMVNSEASLRAFATSTVGADESIGAVRFTSDRVEISYEQSGRLFALWPVTYEVTARTYVDGRVDVDGPWYSVVMADDNAELEAGILAAVSEVVSADAESEINATFSAQRAAEVASRMHAVLMASASARDLQADGEN